MVHKHEFLCGCGNGGSDGGGVAGNNGGMCGICIYGFGKWDDHFGYRILLRGAALVPQRTCTDLQIRLAL